VPSWRNGGSELPSQTFRASGAGYVAAMTPSSIVVILIGIVLALLVNYILGIIVILIGLAMLLMPMLGGSRRRV
jgi:succinate dehydrogenase/fumarate reductase cytochrome b subunit